MKFKLKKPIGKLKKGTILTRVGAVVGTGDSWFEIEMVMNDEKHFHLIIANILKN